MDMQLTPIAGVWELTYACNMRCRHCGSGCGAPLSDELTTKEALALCDALGELGLQRITLSGGEPFMRPDWSQIATRLTQNGITTNAISNGWFITETLVQKAIQAGIVNIAVSLDGYGKSHDMIRKKGSWKRSVKALALMKKMKMQTCVCTSINRKNLKELARIKKVLVKLGVQRWQIQLATPMGNMLEHPELIIEPADLAPVVDFMYRTMQEKKLIIDLADSIGYCSATDEAIRRRIAEKAGNKHMLKTAWQGCQAGKRVIGIRANGAVCPCLSLRDDGFIEDNIRQTPLKTIWHRSNAFEKLRNLCVDDLQGFCRTCPHAATCLGGCTCNKTFFHHGKQENRFCLFRIEMEAAVQTAAGHDSADGLIALAREAILQKQFYHALIYIQRALLFEPNRIEALQLAGFACFFLNRFDESLRYNEQALLLSPEDTHALHGKGMCLTRLDRYDEGLAALRQAARQTGKKFMDPYYDMAVVLIEHERLDEARKALDQGCAKNPAFLPMARPLYKQIKNRIRRHQHISMSLS
jgi:radical SAM protein with 4Fe4S-binding SPASM domain